MRLSPHFTLAELTASQTATRHGIDNTPTGRALENLKTTARNMERVRAILGNVPIHVSSGFRCLELNRRIGSKDGSDHPKGLAVDFRALGLTVPQTVSILDKSDLAFDQLINEFGRWVHIGFGSRMRRQVFKIG